MAGYLKKQRGKSVTIAKEFSHYFDPIYYHEGQKDEVFMMGKERTDVISRELRLCGYFCLITSAKMTAKEALELYKSRDESIHAKIFIEFIALIIRNHLGWM